MTTSQSPRISFALATLVAALAFGGCAQSGVVSLPAAATSADLAPGRFLPLESRRRQDCDAVSNSLNFNGAPIPRGSYLWFTSVIAAPVTDQPMRLTMTTSQVTFTAGRVHYRVFGPNMRLTLSAKQAVHLRFRSLWDDWRLGAPYGTNGNDMIDAMAYRLPFALPRNIQNVTWSAKFFSDANQAIHWRWGAAVYSRFAEHYEKLGVKPLDDAHYPPYNADRAGTPEAFKLFLARGGTGNGGRDFTGALGAPVTVTPCR